MWQDVFPARATRDDRERFVIVPHHPDRMRRTAVSVGAASDRRFEQALHLVDCAASGSRVSSARLFSFAMEVNPVDNRVAAVAVSNRGEVRQACGWWT